MSTRKIEAIYPLSPVQEGILFHTRYAPQSGVYVIQFTCLLEGWLNVGAFQQAWQQVVERHPALRTLFAWERRDKPLQIVRRQVDLSWQEEDWQKMTPEEQAKRLEQLLQADQTQGFDLLKAPLMRFYLLRLARKRYQFVWSSHHLILDGWSASLILEQLFNFYHMLDEGRHLLLQPSRPYKEHITFLKTQDEAKIDAFWRARLHDFSATTPVGIERTAWSEPVEQVFDEEKLYLSTKTTNHLQRFARQHRLTRNTLIQAAWALLLSRYSGERDVLFGTTVSGRSTELADIESMVGLFINTLPVRATMEPESELLSWLQAFDKQQQGRHEYEHSPLVMVQGCSQVPRDQPLFESILVFGNYPTGEALQKRGTTLRISAVRFRERTSYPLTVFIDDAQGQALTLRIGYDAERFEPASIRRMLGHLQTLLESMMDDPRQRVCDLGLLTEAELDYLIVEMNDNALLYDRESCLHQRFEAQALATPDATALIVQQKRFTYRELNEKANQLAHGLQQLGVGPDQLVGVCMERDSLLPVTLLAILKAGGAYVPLDPTYPESRLAFILEDAQVALLLTQERVLKQQSLLNSDKLVHAETKIVCVDRDWGQVAQASTSNPTSEVKSDDLAYVIYTSGSTGKPKGVAIEHHSPVALLAWAEQYFARELFNGMLFSTSICFDLSVFELFMPLSCGGTVILAKNALDLPTLPAAQEVSVINTVPSAIAELLRLDGIPSSVQATILAGEPLKQELVQKIVQKEHIKQVFDLYGPSEDTTYSTYALREADKPATIGRPIANTQLYLLDEYLHPVPWGAIGEIYLGGDGLARGYLNRPRLTGQRFIISPFSTASNSNARLYKTGDLARYTPQGKLEFMGRIDYQVKVRGFRIELGEIEATLTQHASIREAIVVADDANGEEKRLVAYILPTKSAHYNGSWPLSVSELRQFLSNKLPSYMIPAAFVQLDALPLTPNGKINRKALPAPDYGQLQSDTFVAPRTANEALLAQMWSNLLGVAPIGIHDNFFELGGHSLLATKVIARLRKEFEVNLPLSTLFEAPTIADLATTIVQHKAADVDEAMLLGLLEELKRPSPPGRWRVSQ